MKKQTRQSLLTLAATLAIASLGSSCQNARVATAPNLPVEPPSPPQKFEPQKYVLANSFTFLWKEHIDLRGNARLGAISRDMGTVSQAGGDLVTQKFTIAKARAMRADLEQKEAGLLAQRAEVQAKRDGLAAQKDALLKKRAELTTQRETLAARQLDAQTELEKLKAARQRETDPAKQAELDRQIGAIEGELPKLAAGLAQIDAGLQQIDANLPQLDGGLAQIDAGLAQIDGGLRQIAGGKAQIDQKLAEAAQILGRARAQMPTAADEFSEIGAVIFDFDPAGQPQVVIQAWAVDGNAARSFSSLTGEISKVTYEPLGGVFTLQIATAPNVIYAMRASRAKYEMAAQGIVAFHVDIKRMEAGATTSRDGTGKFLGVLSAPAAAR